MKTDHFISKLLIFASLEISISAGFAQQISDSNATGSMAIRFRPGCAPTVAYQKEMQRIMIEEANRFARQMNLSENLPITRSNVVAAYVATPGRYIRFGELGAIDTTNYSYGIAVGKGVTTVNLRSSEREWNEITAKYTWPMSRLDTNVAFHEALQIMKEANVDVDAINRDAASVDISASMAEGPHVEHFVPVYWISWQKAATNVAPRDLLNGRQIAFLAFLEPTKMIRQLNIHGPKYILRNALETPDLFALLTTDPTNNPPEAVLRELESGTNVQIMRQIYLEGGALESFLKKYGLGKTNTADQTNAPNGP